MSHSKNIFDVHQGTSGKYSVQLVDQNLAALSDTVLEELELTLYDTSSDDIINSRDEQNVLNTNQVTVDSDGVLTWLWVAADMPILGTREAEIHTALFRMVWGSGTLQAFHEVSFRVHEIHTPS